MTTGKRKVFEVGDLITVGPKEKERFSAIFFKAIVAKARDGDIAAVNWLVEHGFMSVNRNEAEKDSGDN